MDGDISSSKFRNLNLPLAVEVTITWNASFMGVYSAVDYTYADVTYTVRP